MRVSSGRNAQKQSLWQWSQAQRERTRTVAHLGADQLAQTSNSLVTVTTQGLQSTTNAGLYRARSAAATAVGRSANVFA